MLVALVFWLIPAIFIGSIQGKIDLLNLKESLNQADREMLNNLQWNKVWWETIQSTVFNPISTIMLALGLILIVYGFLTKIS